MTHRAILLLATALVAACTNVGPRTNEILGAGTEIIPSRQTVAGGAEKSSFVIVEADRNVAFTWRMFEASRDVFFADRGPGRVSIQSGDVLAISLVSINEEGFIDFASNSIKPIATTPLPAQVVTEQGTINVPPAGRIMARGLTIPALEDTLKTRLSEVLVNPSVAVELAQRNGALVSLLGDIGSPGSYAYKRGDARLLDMISLAGGASSPIAGLDLALSRDGVTRRVPLADVYADPKLNIHIRPGDVIALEPRNNSVVVLGASEKNQQLTFNTPTLPLSDVIGQIGGLVNRRADPRGVFLYRPTPRNLAAMLGIDTTKYPGEEILVVYRFNLKEPQTFFTLSEFEVRDGDILYVANSRYEELDAALDIFSEAVLRPIQIGRELDGD